MIPMRTKPYLPSLRRAFTRTDLLALLALISLLGALVLPIAAKPAQRTLIAQCSANLKQFATAAQLYAAENENRLPTGRAGSWPWDIPRAAADSLESLALGREKLYCPSVRADIEIRTLDAWWNFAGSSFAVIGYAHTFSTGTSVVETNLNTSILPSAIRVTSSSFLPPPSPSNRALLADATLSSGNDTQIRTNNTYVIEGGLGRHRPAHMEGMLPSGGNVAMLDGRVVWRAFDEMQPRTSFVPYFWW
jgi:hypothetical protein